MERFDHLDAQTKLLHTTKRRTQPWKTGLPIDFTLRDTALGRHPRTWLRFAVHRLLGPGRYRRHPDPRQETLFFALLHECVEAGTITRAMLCDAMARNHVRHDALRLLGDAAATMVK